MWLPMFEAGHMNLNPRYSIWPDDPLYLHRVPRSDGTDTHYLFLKAVNEYGNHARSIQILSEGITIDQYYRMTRNHRGSLERKRKNEVRVPLGPNFKDIFLWCATKTEGWFAGWSVMVYMDVLDDEGAPYAVFYFGKKAHAVEFKLTFA